MDKRLIKYFALFFLLGAVLFSWDNLSWIFNYRAVYEIAESYLNPPVIEPKLSVANAENPDKSAPNYTEKEDSIEISKLDISAPIIFSQATDEVSVTADLKKGVIHYPSSAMPGTQGDTLILGHSAPPGWPKINYDWVFSNINKLEKGDEIIVNYGHKKFAYTVTGSVILDKGQDVPSGADKSKNNLTIISCWPPGKNYKRIGVQAELLTENK